MFKSVLIMSENACISKQTRLIYFSFEFKMNQSILVSGCFMLEALNQTLVNVQADVPFVLKVMAVAWAIQCLNVALAYRLNVFGILPRRLHGLIGVFVCPLLHGSWSHIFMNSFFFFALALIVLVKGKLVFWVVTAAITVLSGLIVWVVGRRALHVGASGLVVGYWSYTLMLAYTNPSLINFLGAGIGVFYFGVDLLASMLPQGKKVSVEGHIAGFVAGLIVGYYLPGFVQLLGPGLIKLGVMKL